MADRAEGPEDGRALYRLRPEEFTAARDALARRLRAGGDRAGADEIKRLRRPNPPAWALNQVAQTQPELIDDVLEAGGDLREAMEIGDGRRLREAERSAREASDAVVGEAERLLAEAGQSVTDDVRARLAGTLRTAVVDPSVAERLQAGMLERDVEVAGFGLEMPAPPESPAVRRPARRRPPKDDAHRQEREEQEQRARQEQAERRAREEARRSARRRLAEVEAEAKRLSRHADRLAGVADRAEEEARQARAAADAAEAEAEAAAIQAGQARQALAELGAE